MHYEITKPANDPRGEVAGWINRLSNRVTIVETLVDYGFRMKMEIGETPRSGNLGEIAVDEYATQLA